MPRRVFVCQLADVVADELRSFTVKGLAQPVIVTSVDERLVAVTGTCPHKGVDLVDGYLHAGALMCPAHAYTFDLQTGRCVHDPKLELRRYPITVVGDQIWVDIS